MKKLLITLTLAAGLCGAFVWLPDACGQNGAPAPRASRIAFVDLGEVFRQYKKTEDMSQDVKTAMKEGNARIEQMVGQGREMEKPLRDGTLDKETPAFAEREKKVVQLATNVSAFKAVKEKELKQQEVKVLVSVYQDVTEAVRQFAEQNGYTLVLKVDREAQAAKSYKTVQQTMNQSVIRHDSRDDITDAVVAYLNKQYESAGGAPASPTAAKAPASNDSAPRDRVSSDKAPPAGARSAGANAADRSLPTPASRRTSPR